MKSVFFTILGLLLVAVMPAFAAEPIEWGIGMQPSAAPVHERMTEFHDNLLMPIITGITIFVFILLVIVVFKFNKKANPEPSKTTHNVPLEIAWTLFPVIILIIISVPSFKLLYYSDRAANPEMTLKVVGYQWYWGYEYPDHEIDEFSSYMIPDEDINKEEGQKRLLSTDNVVVLPTDTDIQIIVTAGDVIHNFAMPAFGLKTDAIPGRLNETWVRITKPGTYYGQCSELCGKDHAFMPIEIRVVSQAQYDAWVGAAVSDVDSARQIVASVSADNNVQLASAR